MQVPARSPDNQDSGLRIRLFGEFQVEGLGPHQLGSRKARLLLKVLALSGGTPVPVDDLAEACWGEEGDATGRAGDVAVLVSRLRRSLGRERIVHVDGGYALRADWTDWDAMSELAEEAARRLATRDYAAAHAAAKTALALARGPLLAGEPPWEWAEAHRAAAARLLARLRHIAAESSLAVGDSTTAVEAAEEALASDPYDEHALRLLMAALAASGRSASALAAYSKLRDRLVEELGVDPDPVTDALHTAILQDAPLPGVVIGPDADLQSPVFRPDSLPGRSAELATLSTALDQAPKGPCIITIEGEAGIGKTTLLHALTTKAQEAGFTVLRGRCDELGRSLPLQPVLDALAEHLTAVGQEQAHAILGPEGSTLLPLLPLGHMAQSVSPGPGFAEEAIGPLVLYNALLTAFERAGGDRPAVLLLDDVHLAGHATVDWLRFLAQRKHERRLLVITARRPEEGPEIPATHRIPLGPLDLEAAAEIVGKARAADLHARSRGNPLFLTELASVDHGELPASIREAVVEACQRAGDAAGTLRTAALLGNEIDLDLLATVTGAPPTTVLGHLEEGVRRRFLEEQGTGFVFRHDLMREALVSESSPARSAAVHREAARALAARQVKDPMDIAYHATLGGDTGLAANAYHEASAIAVERADYREAEALLDKSLDLLDSPDTRLARAHVRTLLRRFTEAQQDAETALDQGAGAPALEAAGWAAYFQRDFTLTQRCADDGARIAVDPQVRARCLTLAGRVRHATGDLVSAETHFLQAAALAEGPQRAIASVWLGTLRVHQSRTEEAMELVRFAARPGALPGNWAANLHAITFIGYANAVAGHIPEALTALGSLAAEVERRHVPRFAGLSENFRGWIMRNLGAAEEADELNRTAFRIDGRGPTSETRLAAHLDLAEGALFRGDLHRAAHELDQAAQLFVGDITFGWRLRFKMQSHRARLALALGRCREAAEIAADLADRAQELGVPRYAVPARLLAARARAREGEPVDLEAVEGDLRMLPKAIALEAWWLTAEAARDCGVDRWWALAEERLASLAGQAGDYQDTLLRNAPARLEALRNQL